MKSAAWAGVAAGIGASIHGSAQAESAIGQGAQTVRPPNILLLFPDQWRFDWMSDHPDRPIRTPNLDRLARMGTRFDRAIVASPVCAPSRACLASGMEYERQRTPRNAVNYPIALTTIYTRLREGGYYVLGCGKMDLAKGSNWWGTDGKWRVRQWGFSDGVNNAGKWDQLTGLRLNDGKPPDPYLSFLDSLGLMKMHVDDYQARLSSSYGSTFPTPLPDDAYCDNWVTEIGLKLLDAAPHAAPDKPWFMQVNWPGPHDPEDITARMEKSVRGRAMPAVVGKNEFDAAKNQLIRQNYTAMCENIDGAIGRFLDRLEANGQLANTLVLFSSDHGEMLGDHGRWGKTVPYHPSASVPIIIAGPGIRAGVRSSALVSSIDLSATMLDYGGVPSKDIDGRSLRALLEGKAARHREVVYSGLSGWRLAWDGRYKVITGFSPELTAKNDDIMTKYDPDVLARPPMVFDLEQDPSELKDIASSPPAAAQALLHKLAAGNYPA